MDARTNIYTSSFAGYTVSITLMCMILDLGSIIFDRKKNC